MTPKEEVIQRITKEVKMIDKFRGGSGRMRYVILDRIDWDIISDYKGYKDER